jgi:hypothetical protein
MAFRWSFCRIHTAIHGPTEIARPRMKWQM